MADVGQTGTGGSRLGESPKRPAKIPRLVFFVGDAFAAASQCLRKAHPNVSPATAAHLLVSHAKGQRCTGGKGITDACGVQTIVFIFENAIGRSALRAG